jgi:hypothetical protein
MSSDFKLNSTTYDIERNTNNNGWLRVENNEAVSQNVKQRLQTVKGEWFLNTSIHVDLWDLIFVKGTPAAVIESHIKGIIAETPGFVEFRSFNMDIDNNSRNLTINFTIECDYNTIITDTITI